MSIIGPDSSLGTRRKFALVTMDYYSKGAEAGFLQEVSAGKIVSMLTRVFYRESIPEVIVTDNGKQFVGREVAQCPKRYGVQHRKTPVCRLQTKGLVNRSNRTLGDLISTAKSLEGQIDKIFVELIGASMMQHRKPRPGKLRQSCYMSAACARSWMYQTTLEMEEEPFQIGVLILLFFLRQTNLLVKHLNTIGNSLLCNSESFRLLLEEGLLEGIVKVIG